MSPVHHLAQPDPSVEPVGDDVELLVADEEVEHHVRVVGEVAREQRRAEEAERCPRDVEAQRPTRFGAQLTDGAGHLAQRIE
jgi:hypothetical protein